MSVREINFDGIVGPSHNYAGLSFGNVASMSHAGQISQPRAAALQGLEKMRANLALGLAQGIFLPHPRPNRAWLAQLAAVIEHADKPLFQNRQGGRLSRAGVRYLLQKYVQAVRRDHPGFTQPVSPHSLRHTKGMHLLQSGVPLEMREWEMRHD